MIIGLCGLAGAGKTTAAIEFERAGFTRRSFAAPIKTCCAAMLAVPIEYFTDPALKEEPLYITSGPTASRRLLTTETTPRKVMQTFGTDVVRAIDPDFWVKAGLRGIDPGDNYVFDDVRFENEVRGIQALGGVVVYITRPGLIAGAHPSEQAVLAVEGKADILMRNDRSLDSWVESCAALAAALVM